MNAKKELTVELAEGICKTCGDKREVYYLSDFLYGEKLLRTEDGKHYVYLNCFDDTAFDEIELILKSIFANKNLSQEKEIEYFNKIFGISCDSVNGVKIDGSKTKIACLSCGSEQLTINEKFPPEMVQRILPEVTHNLWDQMDKQMKKQAILSEFKKRCIV